MSQPSDEIRIEYDEGSRGYYIIWQPLTTIGMGGTEREALEDLRTAAYFGIDTMIDSKLREIGADLSARGGTNGKRNKTKKRGDLGHG
jgi:hypothetical protein